jgi:hypothetical protein
MSQNNPRLQTTADKNDGLTETARQQDSKTARLLESACVSSNSRRLAALLQNPNDLPL